MDNLEEMDRFLEKLNLPRLTQEEIKIMNNPITSTKIETDQNLPRGCLFSPLWDVFLSRFPRMQLRPIEINPTMLSRVLVWLAVASQWHSEDILGWEEASLAWQPGAALPTHRTAGELQGKQTGDLKGHKVSPEVCLLKQAIGNSCGNMGFIRAAADDQDKLEFEDGSILKQRHCPLKT